RNTLAGEVTFIATSTSSVGWRKLERVKQIVQSRAVRGCVGIARGRDRVGKIVPAATGNRWQVPVSVDELDQRNVVPVAVIDVAARRIRRDDEQWNAGAVTEEV